MRKLRVGPLASVVQCDVTENDSKEQPRRWLSERCKTTGKSTYLTQVLTQSAEVRVRVWWGERRGSRGLGWRRLAASRWGTEIDVMLSARADGTGDWRYNAQMHQRHRDREGREDSTSGEEELAMAPGAGEMIPETVYRSKKGAAALKGEGSTAAAEEPKELKRSFREGKSGGSKLLAPAIFEKPIQLHSPQFYAISTAGGITSCSLTHTMVTPLDVIKCNMQTDPQKYRSIPSAFSTILKEQGLSGLVRGWVPTFIGYGAQGACKFGFYEFFKKCASLSPSLSLCVCGIAYSHPFLAF